MSTLQMKSRTRKSQASCPKDLGMRWQHGNEAQKNVRSLNHSPYSTVIPLQKLNKVELKEKEDKNDFA